MKSFDDFRNSLTKEDMIQIANEANELTKGINHSDGLQIGTVSALVAYSTTMELLKKYHDWLQE
ncbi:hypothetical protein [Streptococcus sp. NLN64]|uniref:hypothetical protein n=1 Tax=Streptococcus sp. NLN64 TaxID=2822799 RepID=UPI0018CAAA45|nr:hypothetical protein [Streptococcus sp. NLN64]MBG9366548.1 hypothetical protein [Streptococcus sp. NLN64]